MLVPKSGAGESVEAGYAVTKVPRLQIPVVCDIPPENERVQFSIS